MYPCLSLTLLCLCSEIGNALLQGVSGGLLCNFQVPSRPSIGNYLDIHIELFPRLTRGIRWYFTEEIRAALWAVGIAVSRVIVHNLDGRNKRRVPPLK